MDALGSNPSTSQMKTSSLTKPPETSSPTTKSGSASASLSFYEANRSRFVDGRGVRITTGLFEELANPESSFRPTFKLADWRKVYVETEDPTGYTAAAKLMGNWEHWLLLAANPVFAAHLAEWNKEVEIRLRSKAVKQMIKHSSTPSGVAAAKWLAEGGFVERDKRSKAAREEEAQREKAVRGSVAADAARLGLTRVK